MIVRSADSVEAGPVEMPGAEGCRIRLLIHRDQGAPNFYMRQFTLAPGGHTPRHAHDWEHEVYVVAGRGTAVGADGEHPVRAGDCVYVPPNEEHQFRNAGDAELTFLCLVPATSG